MTTQVIWFPLDLRLTDSLELLATGTGAERVLPLYVLSEDGARRAIDGIRRWLMAFGMSRDSMWQRRAPWPANAMAARGADACDNIGPSLNRSVHE